VYYLDTLNIFENLQKPPHFKFLLRFEPNHISDQINSNKIQIKMVYTIHQPHLADTPPTIVSLTQTLRNQNTIMVHIILPTPLSSLAHEYFLNTTEVTSLANHLQHKLFVDLLALGE
jgi:hypothetical protein